MRACGLCGQVEEGEYYLEDLNGSVALNLAGCEMTPGLFTEGCIVLTLGHMVKVVTPQKDQSKRRGLLKRSAVVPLYDLLSLPPPRATTAGFSA